MIDRRRLGLLALCALLTFATGSVQAARYTGMKEAVQSLLGQEGKLLQKRVDLTDEQAARLQTMTGWTPKSREQKLFYARSEAGDVTGYAVFMTGYWEDQASSKHLLCIGLDPRGESLGVVVVELTDPYAFPIRRKSFLQQFVGLPPDRTQEQARRVDVVTGATGSCHLVADLVLRAQALLKVAGGA